MSTDQLNPKSPNPKKLPSQLAEAPRATGAGAGPVAAPAGPAAGAVPGWFGLLLRWPQTLNDQTTAWLSSLLFHMTAFVFLGLTWAWVVTQAPPPPVPVADMAIDLSGGVGDEPTSEYGLGAAASSLPLAATSLPAIDPANARPSVDVAAAEIGPQQSAAQSAAGLIGTPDLTRSTVGIGQPTGARGTAAGGASSSTNGSDLVVANLRSTDLLSSAGSSRGGGLAGRSGALKWQLINSRGGNEATEAAVQRGLRWLAAHQQADGSWRFDLKGPCDGNCRNAGDFASINASTSLALLPFLAAGHTHRAGDYVDTVQRGIAYLVAHATSTPSGADLQSGSMYSQGLATIVLCEAYAMSHDEALRPTCDEALRFIIRAQHEQGGWRYIPGQPGDVTSTGWQLMGLKSGQLAKIPFDRFVFYRASRFLDSLESADHAGYGYQTGRQEQCTTAIGLYSRLLTGWTREHADMKRGGELLAKWGPSANDMYYNYYATMVLNQLDTPAWPLWNQKMRSQLLRDQATEGHEAGSWYYDHHHARPGGRLYVTAMAVLTLEVYYRFLPLYDPQASGNY
ncbi:MAG: terpene cyclase/mutase family protein [Planctomycetia bacterium]|nr:terpene cyclase/mutase family protein [Planctomycetia bacterium]